MSCLKVASFLWWRRWKSVLEKCGIRNIKISDSVCSLIFLNRVLRHLCPIFLITRMIVYRYANSAKIFVGTSEPAKPYEMIWFFTAVTGLIRASTFLVNFDIIFKNTVTTTPFSRHKFSSSGSEFYKIEQCNRYERQTVWFHFYSMS